MDDSMSKKVKQYKNKSVTSYQNCKIIYLKKKKDK